MQAQKQATFTAKNRLPLIETFFHVNRQDPCQQLLSQLLQLRLKQILPPFFIADENEIKTLALQEDYLKTALPLILPSAFQTPPFQVSFFVLSHYSTNSFKFIFEMISRWLVPGKRLNVLQFQAVDFRFVKLSAEKYTLIEITLEVETAGDAQLLQTNLPIVESEIRLGLRSPLQAKRILEIRGLAADEKTAHIHEQIATLSERLPKLFDQGVFIEMQHVLVKSKDEFKATRDSKLLAKLISYHYLFRRAIEKNLQEDEKKRYLYLKLLRIHHPLVKDHRLVLGIIVGVNFLKEKEVFEERHILKAVQNYIPNICAVEGSFFANTRSDDTICTLYLEICKCDRSNFSDEELNFLRRDLPNDLKDRIEHLMHPIFMPRNEEEVMRNILSLSNQIKFVRDIPQVVISFDQQTDPELVFTIIWVRVLKGDSDPLEELMQRNSSLTYVHDRNKIVGYLRKKYPKEAVVFHVKMDKEPYLRTDHSIDLYKARQTVVDELSQALGPFRDFNGGMISKQNELLLAVRSLLSQETRYNDFLLENFFYSLNPVILRSVLPPKALCQLFQLLLKAMDKNSQEKQEKIKPLFRSIPDYFLAIIPLENGDLKDKIQEKVNALDIPSSDIGHTFVTVYSTPYLAYIYRTDDKEKIKQLKSELLLKEPALIP